MMHKPRDHGKMKRIEMLETLVYEPPVPLAGRSGCNAFPKNRIPETCETQFGGDIEIGKPLRVSRLGALVAVIAADASNGALEPAPKLQR